MFNSFSFLLYLKRIDITGLSIDEMDVLFNPSNCDWLPDDAYVYVIRTWINAQNQNISKICSYLTLQPTVPKELYDLFADAIYIPNTKLNLKVNDIIHQLGTSGGVHQYQNPFDLNLLSYECPNELPAYSVKTAYQNDESKFFQSTVKQHLSVTFIFPPYLQVLITSYVITLPKDKKGIKSWTLEGSNNKTEWELLDQRTNDTTFQTPGQTGTFSISQIKGPYRYFKLTNTDQSYMNTYQIIFKNFDISGELELVPC